ncbi:GNAT family N-acetyltransferase [Luedemannella helvata]|uniref:N-acetyltransferase domain-containing protein n=1 Tax=Luedemannella helvata TaxID=349315 RepID=A0ABN2JT95_9ACTN
MSADVVVTRATRADRDRVVATVVAAFATDPAFRFFFPADETYADQATVFARYLFDKRVDLGTVWIVDGGASVAMWQASTAETPGLSLDLPDDALARIEAADVEVHALLPGTPYFYLGILATHPHAAGRRWGRAVMAAGLAAAADLGLPAYLETTTPANVALYERAGWRVTGTAQAGPLPLWVLSHRGGA